MSKTLSWLKEHPLTLFFPIAYAISWMIWLTQLAFAQEFLSQPASPYLHLLGALGPMLTAIIVTGFLGWWAGLRELVRRMFRWRVGLPWHLLAWFGLVALFAIAAIIVHLTSGAWPDVSRFGQSEEYPQPRDFEKMEIGLNARAIDFAKFGALFLNDGIWQGQQVISAARVDESGQPLYPEQYVDYYSDISLPESVDLST